MSWPATGIPTREIRWSLAPGEAHDDPELHAVPYLRCSEHASASMQSKSIQQQETASPRCMNLTQQAAGTSQRGPSRSCLPGRRVPGTSLVSIMSGRRISGISPSTVINARHNPMSDTCRHAFVNRTMPSMTALITGNRNMPGMKDCAQGNRNMSDMKHEYSLPCICSHVGYNTEASRLRTCPGQRAHLYYSRPEACPGQRAHKHFRRSVTCPGQSAHKPHHWTVPAPSRAQSHQGPTAQGRDLTTWHSLVTTTPSLMTRSRS